MNKKTRLLLSSLLCTLTLLGSGTTAQADLIGHWKLDVLDNPNSGQTPDELGLHHANLLNGATLKPGKFGCAMWGDGVSGQGAVAYDSDGGLTLGTSNFTVAWWVNLDTNAQPGGEFSFVEKFTGAGGPNAGWTIYSRNHNAPANNLRDVEFYSGNIGSVTWGAGGGIEFIPGQWYHMALTRSGNVFTLYINGQSKGGQSLGAPNANVGDSGDDVWMGRRNASAPGHPFYLDGGLDDVRLYNAALDANAVAELMTAYAKCRSDFNEDGLVNLLDLQVYSTEWLSENCLACIPCLANSGDVVLEKRGTASSPDEIFSSYDLIFRGSKYDGAPVDVESYATFKPAGGGSFSHGELSLNNVDNFIIRDEDGFEYIRFLSGRNDLGDWKEAYFSSNEGTYLLNVKNTNGDGEAGIRLWKGDNPNQWLMFVPSQPGYKFAIIRDALIDAFVLDEDGKCMIGRLPPNDYGPPEGRFHVRGMVNEIQAIVEASSDQTNTIFEVTNRGRSVRHFLVNAVGNVGIGTANPQGRLDVNGAIYQRGSVLHADYVYEDGYVLESIEEHAERTWRQKHLPAIPARQVDPQGQEIVEWGSHQKGIVEELEKAHLYIEQLNEKIKQLEAKIEALQR